VNFEGDSFIGGEFAGGLWAHGYVKGKGTATNWCVTS